MDHVTTEAGVADAVRSATGPLVIRGGGTRKIGRLMDGTVLDVSHLSGITLYEPGALTLVAQAGTPLAEIETALAAENQRLAFEPGDMTGLLGTTGVSTIGGVMATNASGPRRIQAGAARDFALGVRFIDGTGQVIKNGGRVMKNVTGYDLVKLMVGAQGTLGVLTEVSLKVLPSVETETTLILPGLAPEAAVRAMSRALGSPYEVTSAAWIDGDVWLRLEGFEASVAYRADALATVLRKFGDVDAAAADWTRVRDVQPLHGSEAVWRISVKPTDGPVIVAAAPEGARTMMDWGGGLVWVGHGASEALHVDLQAKAQSLGGHATLIKGRDAMRAAVPVFQPEAAPVAALSAQLRLRFDPRGILNPGLMAA